MQSDNELRNGAGRGLDKYTALALIVSLVLYPLLYSLDFFSTTFPSLVKGIWEFGYFGEKHRQSWWFLWVSNFIYHWVPFLFVWFALFKNRENWDSIGLNLKWFVAKRYWIVVTFCALSLAAIVVPEIYYAELPKKSHTVPFGPISTAERFFMVVMAFTTGFTEEVLFRGFAFTRLQRLVRNSYVVLTITIISFWLIHGQPESVGRSLNYIISGAVFGGMFILLKYRRLEFLVLIHFLINASLVIAP